MYMSVISLHELEHGVLLVERRDISQGQILRKWLDSSVMRAFEDRLIPIDATIVRAAAALHVPDPAPLGDAFIAATALVNDMSVVTQNVGDFDRFTDVQVINPWI